MLRFLGRYTIKVPPTAPAVNDVRVTWNLDKHGFVYIQSAQLMEEVKLSPEEEQAAAAADTKDGGKVPY